VTGRFFARTPITAPRRRVFGGANTTARGGPGLYAEVEMDHIDVDTRRLVDALVPLIVGAILARTDAGKDVNGNAFKPYSQSHKRTRAKKGLSISPVDLRMTGRLMGSIGLRQVQIEAEGVLLTIAPSATEILKARAIEQDGRLFVGLSPADMQRLAKGLEARGIPVRITEA
jgi:hypothetical protein